MKRPFQISKPTRTGLYGREPGGSISVTTGKPPKLRFRPGTIVEYKGQVYEIVYAYRVKADPHEWFYCLEERSKSGELVLDQIGSALQAMGAGRDTPRVVYEIFRDHGDANTYFFDIPVERDRNTVKNKDLLKGGKVLSQGTK